MKATERAARRGGDVDALGVQTDGAGQMTRWGRKLFMVGGLWVSPLVRLSLPSRRLFGYLALRDGPVSRRMAADQLWTDLPEAQARANVRRTLWQSPAGWVSVDGDHLKLEADVDLPLARSAAIRALDGQPLCFDEITLLSNDLLPGWHEEWATTAQDAFHLLRVQALEAACTTMAGRGLYALATQAGTAALAADPFRESAAAALIYAHLLEGNRHAAIRRLRDFSRELERELGVGPDPALAAAVQAARTSPAELD